MELNQKQIDILLVAEELIANNGFVGTSVRDIAKKAGVNVAMISYYFGSKEKLLQKLLIYRTENSRNLLTSLKKNEHIDSWKKIEAIVDYYVDTLLENRKFHTIISRQLSMIQDEKTIALLIKIKKASRTLIQEILDEGQRKGIFKEVDTLLLITTVIGTISQVSMSKPFYKDLLSLSDKDDHLYFEMIKIRLKKYLKSLMRTYLSIKKL